MDGTLNLPTFNIGMSLRTKTLGLLLFLLVAFVVLLYGLSRSILLEGFADLERDLAREDLQRVLNVLDSELAALDALVTDWAEWDDTYAFVAGEAPGYSDSNLIDETFEVLRLNVILIFDRQGNVFYGKAYQLDERQSVMLNDVLIEQYVGAGSLRQYYASAIDTSRHASGVVRLPHGPMLVSIHPVLTSKGDGPPRGTMVMGRYLDRDLVGRLATTAAIDLEVHAFNAADLPPDFARAREELTAGNGRHIDLLSEDSVAGYALLDDISGKPALILRVLLPRNVYDEASDTVHFFLLGLLGWGLLLVVVALILLERQVLARVLRLSNAVSMVGRSGKLDQRVQVGGRDELALLAANINGMLDTVQQAQKSLSESQLRAQRIITSISDVLYVAWVNPAGDVIEHQLPSPQLADLTGYPLTRFQADWHFWQSLIHPDDRARTQAQFDDALHGKSGEVEYRITRADGALRWVRDSLHPSIEPDGSVVLYGVISDVTARKQAQDGLAESERTARAFQERLKSLLDVSVELAEADTLDALCHRTVELGHARLGFDRIGVFLLEDGGATMAGTYGIDEQGNVRAIHDLRRPVAEDPVVEQALADHKWTYIWHDTTLHDQGAAVGRGWNAMASLWDGDGTIGWIATDNLLSGQPLEPYQVELLSLLSNFVSHQVTRVRAESALRNSEARYRALFEEANDAIFMMRDSIFVDCNPQALEMFGVPREQIIGQPPYRFSPPRQPDSTNSRELARDKLKLALDSGPQVFEWQHMRADGTLFDAEVSLSRVVIEGQVFVQALVRDITARKATERALRESEERYFTLFNRMPVELYRSTPDGELLDANPALARLMGYASAEEMRRANTRDFYVDAGERERWREILQCRHTVRDFEVRLRRRDGSIFWASDTAHVVCDESGVVQYYEGSIRDITTRKQAQDALAAERNMLRTLIDALPDRIYAKDRQGKFILSNAANAQALGAQSPDEVLGKSNFDYYSRELADRYNADDMRVIASGQPLLNHIEPAYHTDPGDVRWIATTKVPLRDADGSVIGLVGVGHDITAQREIQDVLRQNQERLDLALQAAGLGLWDWYLQTGRVIYNERWAEISGYSLDELGEREGVWETLVHPDDWLAVNAQLQAHLAGEQPIFEIEYRMRTRSGEWKWILDRGKVVSRAPDGAPLRMTGTLLDITARKQAEAEREKLLQQMRTRAAELATVAEISRQATRILDIDDLLWKTCDLIRENFDLYHVQVYLLSDDGERLVWSAGKGAQDTVTQKLHAIDHFIPVTHEKSLVARAAREREAVLANDVTQEEQFLPNALLPDTQAEMVLPMIVGDTLIGVLDVQDSVRNRFDKQDLHIQTTLAAQVAIALYNARLFTDNARRLAIIEHSRDAVALSSLDTPDYFPHYMNPAGLRMIGYESLDDFADRTLDAFYTPEARATLRDVIFPAVRERGVWRGETEVRARDGTAIPVEQTVFLIHDEHGKPRDIATIITDITARRRTENALRRANRAFRALSECNQAMVRATDEIGLLHEVCEIIVNAGGYRMAWVGLVPKNAIDPTLVQPVAHAGVTDGYLEAIPRLREQHPEWRGPSRRALATGEPVIVRDVAVDADLEPWREQALKRGYRASIALPLFSEDTPIGTLNVYADTPHVFDVDEVTLLSELASDIAYGVAGLRARLERQQAVQRLSENEANLSALIENTTAAIWSLDRALCLVTANSNAQQFFRFILVDDPEPETSLLERVQPDQRDVWGALFDRALSGERFVIERDYSSAGRVTSYEIWFSPIRTGGDGVTGVTVFATDVTRRKQDEARLVQLNEQLARRNRQLLALYDAGRVLTATLDEYEIYRVLYNHVVQPVFGADTLVVTAYDAANERINCKFAITSGEEQDVSALPPCPPGAGPTGETIRTGKPRIAALPARDEAEATPGHCVHAGTPHAPRSGIYIPLSIGGKVTSVLSVQHHEADAFTDDDVSLLSAVANQAAVALQNAQLFTAEHQQRTLAEALQATAAAVNSTLDPDAVMDRILANLAQVVPNDAASIMLIEGSQARIVRHIGYEERGLAEFVESLRFDIGNVSKFQQMIDTRQPAWILDTHESPDWAHFEELDWIRSYIGAPILAGERLIGVLNVDSAEVGFFTAQHARRLQAFADQVAVAVQNAQLFAAEREQRQFAETLRDIAATISLSMDPDSVLEALLHNIRRVVPHDAASIMLIEDHTVRVVRAAGFEAYGLDEWIHRLEFDIEDLPIAQEILRTGKPVIIDDTAGYPGWRDFPETRWERAYITVPIQREGGVMGFLNLYSTQPHFFTEQHGERLQAFAHQAANAIMNAQLFAAEREQRALAEALRDTAAAINRTLEFDRVLDFVLANAQRVMPHDAANIMLIEDGVARVVRGRGYDKYGVDAWVKNLRYTVSDVPVWRTMFETGQPFAIPDTKQEPDWLVIPEEEWIRSTVKAPIRVEGRIIGILHLDSETPGTFTQVHAERLQPFADQAAVALRNAEFFAAEHEQRTLAEALRATAEAISGTLEFDEVLERILYYVGLVVPYDSASVLLIDGDEVRVAAQSRQPDAQEYHAQIQALRFTLSETSNLWQMYQTGASLVLSRVSEHKDWVKVPVLEWIRSNAGAPIRHEGQVIGFITLDSATPDFYTGAHADRLQAFADQAAIAIRNAQLFEAVQQYASELEDRVAERTAEVEQQSAQLRAILDSITEGVIYDEKLTVKYTNRALTQLTGYESDEFKRYIDVLRSSDYTKAEFDALIRAIFDEVTREGMWQSDLHVRRKEGSEFEAQLTVTEVRNPDGETVGAVSVLRDVSQEKELQRQKDRFIASASHELRTPLTNFKTRLYLLRAQPEKTAEHLAILNQVVNEMAELVESLLDMSRFERGVIALRRREARLQDLIREVVNVQRAEAETRHIALQAELPEVPLRANIDVQRMRQVITNLLANAINYTEPGGTVTIALVPQGARAQIRVRDTGIGIPQDQIEHVFEPFFRANEEAAEGTGLGLTIAREIVRLHEGTIAVSSVEGEGSTFTVELDVLEA